ncbi:MAG: hypothetical protein M1609_04320, partial [Firmicutes bacterium]|nr:hypothetical protein [Bacillota bacterium]
EMAVYANSVVSLACLHELGGQTPFAIGPGRLAFIQEIAGPIPAGVTLKVAVLYGTSPEDSWCECP